MVHRWSMEDVHMKTSAVTKKSQSTGPNNHLPANIEVIVYCYIKRLTKGRHVKIVGL